MISHMAGPVPRCGRFEVNGEGEVRRVGLVLEPEVDEAVGKEGRGWREGMVWLEKENWGWFGVEWLNVRDVYQTF
jgi:hypothetical protein